MVGSALQKGAFFFADYQGTRQTEGIDTGLIAVPTLAERSGDLSGVAQALTGTVNGAAWAQQLSARLGTAVTAGEPYAQVFPSGQIPVSAWSAPAQALLQYIPAPNEGASSFATSGYAQAIRGTTKARCGWICRRGRERWRCMDLSTTIRW